MGSLRFEKEIVAGCIQDSLVIRKVKQSRLLPKHFSDKKNEVAIKHVLYLHDNNLEINSQNIQDLINRDSSIDARDKAAYLVYVDGLSKYDVTSVEFGLHTMRAKRRDVEFVEAMKKCLELTRSQKSSEEAAELMRRTLSSLDNSDDYDLSEYTSEALRVQRHEQRTQVSSGTTMYMSHGLEYLDRYFPRGLEQATITTIGGTTGVGKSLYLANFIRSALLQGMNVLYVIAENRKLQAESRLDAIISGTNYENLFSRSSIPDARPFQDLKGKLFTVKYNMSRFTVDDISATLSEKGREGNAVDILFIDSPDHMKPVDSSSFKSSWEVKGAVYTEIKYLCDEYQIPIVTSLPMKASAAGKKRVQAEDAGGSYDISRIADNQIFFLKNEEDALLNRRRLEVVKNRDGNMDGMHIELRLTDCLRFIPFDQEEEDVGNNEFVGIRRRTDI